MAVEVQELKQKIEQKEYEKTQLLKQLNNKKFLALHPQKSLIVSHLLSLQKSPKSTEPFATKARSGPNGQPEPVTLLGPGTPAAASGAPGPLAGIVGPKQAARAARQEVSTKTLPKSNTAAGTCSER